MTASTAPTFSHPHAGRNWFQRMADAVFGAEPSPLGVHRLSASVEPALPEPDTRININATRGPRPRMQVVYDALAEAAASYEYNEVRPLRELVPGTVFRLEQIRTVCSSEGMALLGDVVSLRRAHRNKGVISKIASLGFDLSHFADWRIEMQDSGSDPALDGDMLTVIAGDGTYRVKLHFQFYGSFDEDANLAQPATVRGVAADAPVVAHANPHAIATATTQRATANPAPAAAATLVATPVRPPFQGAATLVDPSALRPRAATVLARLRLADHQGQEQVFDITRLPYEIGREPELPGNESCAVPAQAIRVSRVHLRLEKMQGGAIVVNNLAHQRSGTWSNGECLDEHFTLVPVSAQSRHGWHILGERELGAQSVAMRIEAAA